MQISASKPPADKGGKIKIPKRPDTDGLGIAPTPIPVGIQPFRLLGDLFA